MFQTSVALTHYAILAAMLAPALFLTASGSLLIAANNRLARIIERTRVLLASLEKTEDPQEGDVLDRRIAMLRKRMVIVMRASQSLYTAICFFVATSLAVAADSLLGYRLGATPTVLAVAGVLCLFAASLLLAREAVLTVRLVKEEMEDTHFRARRRVSG